MSVLSSAFDIADKVCGCAVCCPACLALQARHARACPKTVPPKGARVPCTIQAGWGGGGHAAPVPQVGNGLCSYLCSCSSGKLMHCIASVAALPAASRPRPHPPTTPSGAVQLWAGCAGGAVRDVHAVGGGPQEHLAAGVRLAGGLHHRAGARHHTHVPGACVCAPLWVDGRESSARPTCWWPPLKCWCMPSSPCARWGACTCAWQE